MKHKHRIIQKIKEQYGVPYLHFFRGYKEAGLSAYNGTLSQVVCSTDPHIDKKYRKQNKDLYITARLTHSELEGVLEELAFNARSIKQKLKPLAYCTVLFEPYGLEIFDLDSLKESYLLVLLAGI